MKFDLTQLYETGLVARIEHHTELGSTSDHALELAADDDVEVPLLVLAERQTAGRGRGTNRWWAGDGALTFSLIIEPPADKLPPPCWPRLSLASALAICRALEKFAPQALFQVKWPNDVFAEGRKIAGILIESPVQPRGRLVIGIGVNVNNSLSGAPDEIRSVAASLRDMDGRQHDLTRVLSAILGQLDVHLPRAADMAWLSHGWRERCLLTDRSIVVDSGGEAIAGRCAGIDEQGALVLYTPEGQRSFVSGSVVAWDP